MLCLRWSLRKGGVRREASVWIRFRGGCWSYGDGAVDAMGCWGLNLPARLVDRQQPRDLARVFLGRAVEHELQPCREDSRLIVEVMGDPRQPAHTLGSESLRARHLAEPDEPRHHRPIVIVIIGILEHDRLNVQRLCFGCERSLFSVCCRARVMTEDHGGSSGYTSVKLNFFWQSERFQGLPDHGRAGMRFG